MKKMRNMPSTSTPTNLLSGILLVNKPKDITSFSLIPKFRKIFNQKKIGHGGTLDPLATGLMIYLVGRDFTKRANEFLNSSKTYEATILLGQKTDSYDTDGNIIATNDHMPSLKDIEIAMKNFNGTIEQSPPMYSAKKFKGKKLYEYARAGIEIDIKEKSKMVSLKTTILSYQYPNLKVSVTCSGGTYIRSIAHDLGEILGCFGCIKQLHRVCSGNFHCDDAHSIESIENANHLKELLLPHESISKFI